MFPDFDRSLGELVRVDRYLKHVGAPEADRLHTIGDDSGRFLFLQVLAARPRFVIEIGTSAGYSTAWLAAACKRLSARLATVERDESRSKFAERLLARHGLASSVEFVCQDANAWLAQAEPQWDVALIDGDKSEYISYFELLTAIDCATPRIVFADNLLSHRVDLSEFVAYLDGRKDVTHQLLTIGKGLEMCLVEGVTDE